jgi:flagellar hook assembly protein FlgD
MSQSTKQLVIQNIPREFTLYQNYPNPFNPITTIEYDLPENTHVNLAVYDMLGRKVKTLTDSYQELGYKSVQWDGTDENGISLGSGMYLYRLSTENFTAMKKIVLLK